MRSVTLATFNDREHAQPLVNRLHEAGFHPKISDESAWQRRHFAERLASVKVEVEEGEFDAAKQKAKELDAAEHVLNGSLNCPECNSPDIVYPSVTRKFILPALHALFYRLNISEKEFYCNTCQATWPLREKVEPERDALNWQIKGGPLHRNSDQTP
jgi:hypothetical protein